MLCPSSKGSCGWALGIKASVERVVTRLAHELRINHFRELMCPCTSFRVLTRGPMFVPPLLQSQPQRGWSFHIILISKASVVQQEGRGYPTEAKRSAFAQQKHIHFGVSCVWDSANRGPYKSTRSHFHTSQFWAPHQQHLLFAGTEVPGDWAFVLSC